MNDFSISFEWDPKDDTEIDILQLPEKIAQKKNIHLMENIFNDKSMPFYKFGDMMFLKKIPTEEWVPFICSKFQKTGKSITAEQAARICEATENLSSYVQHLSWVVWYKSDKVVTDNNIATAIDDLLEQNKVFERKLQVENEFSILLGFRRKIWNTHFFNTAHLYRHIEPK